MIARLKNENGMTLLEIIATALIVGVAMVGLYLGIIYADKQVQRNYHDRVATLHASGEIDWQYYYRKNYKQFDTFNSKTVNIDILARGRTLTGQMTMKITPQSENSNGTNVDYEMVEVTVKWLEPDETKTRHIVVREDFY